METVMCTQHQNIGKTDLEVIMKKPLMLANVCRVLNDFFFPKG